jgi:rhodanese-related sulfurtransferase
LKYLGAAILILMILSPCACSRYAPTGTVPEIITSKIVTSDPMIPPSPEELEARHYAYPDFPRMTADRLDRIIKDVKTTAGLTRLPDNFAFPDIVLIDVRAPVNFQRPGHIKGAVNMPFSYYWVLDPQQQPKPESVTAYIQEERDLGITLPTLPKDKTLVFYDETANDMAACMAARMLLDMESGYDPARVLVLYGGYYHYTLDIDHPWVFSN